MTSRSDSGADNGADVGPSDHKTTSKDRRIPGDFQSNNPSQIGIGGEDELVLKAYLTTDHELSIVPGNARREWMDRTALGFANRCLPLRIANQFGWFILNDRKIQVVWSGGNANEDIKVFYFKKDINEDTTKMNFAIRSHFGHGIITWRIPYLFRTPPQYNLYVRGPTNWWKDGAYPLDAIVESDWAVSTFTMNWKITRAETPIIFDEGEPICMIFPIPRSNIERFFPETHNLDEDPELKTKYKAWSESRKAFLDARHQPQQSEKNRLAWQKDYYVGRYPDGSNFSDHQIKLPLRAFVDRRDQHSSVRMEPEDL